MSKGNQGDPNSPLLSRKETQNEASSNSPSPLTGEGWGEGDKVIS